MQQSSNIFYVCKYMLVVNLREGGWGVAQKRDSGFLALFYQRGRGGSCFSSMRKGGRIRGSIGVRKGGEDPVSLA
jgi:hypothetical protein